MLNTDRTGAHALVETLLANGIDTCFANPGTSEMHFVAALRDFPQMRRVLCLFEGGATGAADGYGRMSGRPAATLLHLGPGLANGLANLHNAKKAGTPVVNIVGDHATFHRQFDAPLTSDIEATARPYSHWVRSAESTASLAGDAAEAVAASRAGGGQIASLILPADTAWSPAQEMASAAPAVVAEQVKPAVLDAMASLLRRDGQRIGVVLGGALLHGEGLEIMGRVAAATRATLLVPYGSGRVARGAGTPRIERIPFPIDQSIAVLERFDHLYLLGAKEPVAFFAYPGRPSRIVREGTEVVAVADRGHDLLACAAGLAHRLDCARGPLDAETGILPDAASGCLDSDGLSTTLARSIQPGTIIVDEGITSTRRLFDLARGAPEHDFLANVGGAIGAGLPLALGAGIACPDRPILCVSGDGSAAYTLQALWSIAQHELNVTVVICANRRYAILSGEMERVGIMRGHASGDALLSLENPPMDWVFLARGFGVPATRVTTCEELELALGDLRRGPHLIEAVLG